ncbi:glycosyltransferase [Desulfofustis glycolicus]|uniref:Glycosyltransferase sugar-binding region containing DXD motif-containing protein n=1 Tax=Desulfofustis glycolicus DSM 9705 TaxID=1121409 RepID=A0A1M5WHV2_9BACT|nr:glycosyltransferase [Desulfofustis glycolicus]MCB2216847.1 hypothetical protein [Desulfobulbaceae bacterium]SHH87065.1 Glycosyltransferase sugar-binding region containing DXD motif-containing protein [Desulfofustis glycolicus DSM 9705]
MVLIENLVDTVANKPISPKAGESAEGKGMCGSRRCVIKTLWIGQELSVLEQLSLRSFLSCGHTVELFVYQNVKNVPSGVRLRDAGEILDESLVFRHKRGGGVSGFANWFRYVLLLQEGGMWVDTDVICLKPFDFQQRLVFGRQDTYMINNAVLGGQPGEELFRIMARQAESPNTRLPYDDIKERRIKWIRKYLQRNRRNNIKRGENGPRGITKAINFLGLQQLALPYTAFYPIHPKCWDAIFDSTYRDVEKFFPESYAIHLWNEMICNGSGIDKNATFAAPSLIEALKSRYL